MDFPRPVLAEMKYSHFLFSFLCFLYSSHTVSCRRVSNGNHSLHSRSKKTHWNHFLTTSSEKNVALSKKINSFTSKNVFLTRQSSSKLAAYWTPQKLKINFLGKTQTFVILTPDLTRPAWKGIIRKTREALRFCMTKQGKFDSCSHLLHLPKKIWPKKKKTTANVLEQEAWQRKNRNQNKMKQEDNW